jgi:2-polyprenyl-3-methyl-5-hydroxy-6-metoxy-1,4-benzoquinol methylase
VFHYFQCARCNCLQIEDFPLDVAKYYPDTYYSYQAPPSRNTLRKLLISLRDHYAIYSRGFIGKLLYAKYPYPSLRSISPLPLRKGTHILDVGCGSGTLLYSLSALGFTNLLGVDQFISEDIEYDNRLRVQKKDVYNVEGKWDLVMFHHSFEHLPDPMKTLDAVSRLLNSNGHCVIRIPTVTSHAWKHYGVKWVQLDAPRHFYLHSVKSMKILADKTKFDMHTVIYDSTSFQFWGSEQYKNDIPLCDKRSYLLNPHNSIFSKRQIATFARRAEELNANNQGDQAIFYLRKA